MLIYFCDVGIQFDGSEFFMSLSIKFFEIKIIYLYLWKFQKRKVFLYQKILLLLKAVTTWRKMQERERPKRTVNIFLAGYSGRSWFYDFMGSILWSCRLDSRYRFLHSFRFLYIGKQEKGFLQARVRLDFMIPSYESIFAKPTNIAHPPREINIQHYFILLNSVAISTCEKQSVVLKKLCCDSGTTTLEILSPEMCRKGDIP